MRELTTMVRQIMESSSSPMTRSSKPVTNMGFDDPISEDSFHPSPTAPKPVHLITELQSEFFGEKEGFVSEVHQLGDIVTQVLIDSRQATRRIQLFASLFRCLQLYTDISLLDLWTTLGLGSLSIARPICLPTSAKVIRSFSAPPVCLPRAMHPTSLCP